jgi:hypothetical protein
LFGLVRFFVVFFGLFWFSLSALKGLSVWGFRVERRKKENEDQSPVQQGFESKVIIVENFFI